MEKKGNNEENKNPRAIFGRQTEERENKKLLSYVHPFANESSTFKNHASACVLSI